MEYQLIRSRRRTIALCVARDGRVTVRAPLHAAADVIDRFVAEKRGWVEKQTGRIAQSEAERRSFRLAPGCELPLLGRNIPVCRGEKTAFDGTSFLIPDEEEEQVRRRLAALYRDLAAQIVLPRVEAYETHMGVRAAGVRVGSAGTSWGSCSGKNRLNFTWRLVAAAPSEIDYVVVHELAHLVEHNHSARFWALVGGVLPDYRARREKLKLVGENLRRIGFDR